MTPLFPRWSNTVFRLAILAAFGSPIVAIAALIIFLRTPWRRNQFEALEQPVQFDHRHHTQDDGIDCRYCHSTVDKAATAGIPSTEKCMGCHNQVWNGSPMLDPVRQSYFSSLPIAWNRVHDLPDFVYFDHSVHVRHGVGCATCHGRIDRMPAVEQVVPLTMAWCLDCHRHPEPHLRPIEQVTNMSWSDDGTIAAAIAVKQPVRHLTNCSTCHR
jgi:hypothetical protein